MSGHTRGPWKVYRASNGKILGIGDAEAGGVTDYIGGLWRSGRELEANADLIAAAPELLEALEAAVPYLSGLPHEPAMKIATAIAKARGNTPSETTNVQD